MSSTSSVPTRPSTPTPGSMLNKVPEVTLWFWVIKILCTTVGESFADYVNETLGVGLVRTSVIFTVAFVLVLAVQMRLRRYVPAAYWLTVVVVSVTGTLYTDILTDQAGVPLWISTTVFSVLLAGVFGTWFARERTLSIHSIVTTPRESFYWVAVLVTFALGTATGDWTLQLTGWSPGTSVLLPLGLIAAVTVLWRLGANPVLAFWVAYILTRPLGTSLVFLGAILATVVYLSVSKADVIEDWQARHGAGAEAAPRDPGRERATLGAMGALAVATVALLTYANLQPHADALAAEEGAAPSCAGDPSSLSADAARQQVAASFPAADVGAFRTVATDTLGLVRSGDQAGAATRVTDLESAWDDAEDRLVAKDCVTWTYVDQEIDTVLGAVRAPTPDPTTESGALTALIDTLG